MHAPSPATGAPLPALIQVADSSRSDPGFIGMMIRCDMVHDTGTTTTMFVVADPFPPRARPQVTLRDANREIVFTATVMPSGAAISIPLDIKTQLARMWTDGPDLSVLINYRDTALHGVIDLSGLSQRLPELAPVCTSMLQR